MTVAVVFAISLAVGGWLGVRYSESQQQHSVDLDWLARVEADRDVWEPDELWAAEHQRLTDAATPLACVSVTPAAAGNTSAVLAGGGGHLRPDVERLLANIDRMFNKLNP